MPRSITSSLASIPEEESNTSNKQEETQADSSDAHGTSAGSVPSAPAFEALEQKNPKSEGRPSWVFGATRVLARLYGLQVDGTKSPYLNY